MRIATWNLERAADREKNSRRLDLIASVDADIWVLTETHDEIDLAPLGHRPARSEHDPAARPGEWWVTIWSRLPITRVIAVEDSVRATAVLVDSPFGPLIVFGTVLPWGTDPGPTGDARGWTEHHRVIPLQGNEWTALRGRYPDTALCVAGDFNTNLGGPHYYGTNRGRVLLRTALRDAGLACLTETQQIPEAALVDPPMDPIALSSDLATRCSWRHGRRSCS